MIVLIVILAALVIVSLIVLGIFLADYDGILDDQIIIKNERPTIL